MMSHSENGFQKGVNLPEQITVTCKMVSTW